MSPNFPHTATLPIVTDGGVEIPKEYRWRVEMFDGRPRVVGEHRLFAGQLDGRWSPLRNPDRMAQLLALTPDAEMPEVLR